MTAMKQIWLDKYRPSTLKQVFGNQQAISTLKACVAQGSIPNLILSGPPGIGKTSSLLCIARQLLGDKMGQAFKELNASDERGIDVVREQIKSFAKKKTNLPDGKTKIILLDQADSLTQGAQHALRMIISNESDTTRFVLSCNNPSKIIEPIQSRCIVLRFSKLSDEQIQLNLHRVIQQQKIKITEKGYKDLVFIADGDMRQAINNLQACFFASKGEKITSQIIYHICDAPSVDDIKQCILLACDKKISQSLLKMHEIYNQGHSIYDIVNTLQKIVLQMQIEEGGRIKRDKLLEIFKEVAHLKKRILEGLTTQLQMGKFLVSIAAL